MFKDAPQAFFTVSRLFLNGPIDKGLVVTSFLNTLYDWDDKSRLDVLQPEIGQQQETAVWVSNRQISRLQVAQAYSSF